ncbi:MAG TPA: 23S rRNA (adenine(2503)-C(2))-methyltransferase RlmN [Spirochaetia bacterium]|nr:23S rRNA (adenine(2503)-C(2))-methyltransferase RlmN [Spirochaetia bacterium]
MPDKANLLDYDPSTLGSMMTGLGQPAWRARQLTGWLFQKGAASFAEMTDLPAPLRSMLEEHFTCGRPELVTKRESRDGTVKYLLGLADGQRIEAVWLAYRYGGTACVSTQAGCRMGCRICASGLVGWHRNLTSGEMYGQVLAMEKDHGEPVTHVVLMGMGEPLDNFEAVRQFIVTLSAPYGHGLSLRRITISTCGLVPGISRLHKLKWPVNLAVSLHAPTDHLRDRLVPVNRKYPLAELMTACRAYAVETSRRITFEYALLGGVNDAPEQAQELAKLVGGMLCHVNLIPWNAVADLDLVPSAPSAVRRFQEILRQKGIAVTVRRKLGTDIEGACGQLRLRDG